MRKISKKRLIYDMLCKSAYAAYSSNLVGASCVAAKNRFDFFYEPKIGDMVLEITTLLMPHRDHTQNLGKLLRIEKSPDGNAYCDKWIIQSLYYDREFAWSNAKFIRVLEVSDNFHEISMADR